MTLPDEMQSMKIICEFGAWHAMPLQVCLDIILIPVKIKPDRARL